MLLRDGEVVVGEVLPLIIEVGGSASADGECLVLGRVHEQLIVVGVVDRISGAVSQTGSDRESLDGGEVHVCGTVDAESVGLGIGTVAHDGRVPDEAVAAEYGGAVEQAGRGILRQVISLRFPEGDALRNGVGGIAPGSDRVVGEDGTHEVGSRGGGLGNRSRHVLYQRSGDTDLDPVVDLVVGVDLTGQTVVDILVAGDDTVVLEGSQGDVEVAPVVAALESDGVTLHMSGLEHIVGPVHVGMSVILELLAGSCTCKHHIVHPVLGVHDIQESGDVLERVLIVVEHASASLLGGSGLGGDEDDAVTCLDTVDGGGCGILQNLHGGDVLGIEVIDAPDLQTVDDHQRTGLGVG